VLTNKTEIMKKIIFCTANSEKMLPAIIDKNINEDIILIQLDSLLDGISTATHVTVKGYDDYLSMEDCLEIDKDALKFAANWYKHNGIDCTQYHEYSLAEFIEVAMFKFFIKVLKNILLVQRVVEKETPDKAIIFDDKDIVNKIFSDFLTQNHIEFENITIAPKSYLPDGFERSKMPRVSRNFLGLAKSNLQDVAWSVINKYLSVSARNGEKRARPNSNRLKVYFDTYTGYFGLAERLFNQSEYDVLLPQPRLNDFKRISLLRKVFRGRVIFYPVKHCLKNISPAATKGAREFVEKCWQRFIDFPGCKEYFSWRGINFWNTISETLHSRYFSFFQELILEISYAESTIKKYKINTFLMPWDDGTFNRSFTSVAKRLNLNTIRYQHGIISDYPRLPMPRSNKLVVWGERFKNFYLKAGIESERIIVAGKPPMVDILTREKSNNDRSKFCKGFNLDPAKRIVLFAPEVFAGTSALDHSYDSTRVLLKLVNAANELPEINFIVKFHHADTILGQQKRKVALITKYNKASNILTFDNFNIYKLITNSDAVITEFSTVGLEAMLLDKPVIIFKLRRELKDYGNPYDEGKGVVVVDKEENIAPTIKGIFSDKRILEELDIGRKRFLKESLSDLSGVPDEK